MRCNGLYLKQGTAGQCTRGQPFTCEVPYMELKLTQNFFAATLYFLPLGRYWSAAKSVSVWAQSYSSTWLIVMIWVSCQGYILPLSVRLALAQSTSALRLVAVFLMVAGRLLVASLLPDWIWLQKNTSTSHRTVVGTLPFLKLSWDSFHCRTLQIRQN